MRRSVLTVIALGAVILPACHAPHATRMDFSPVAVRFAVAPHPRLFTEGQPDNKGLARSPGYNGFVEPTANRPPATPFHVALWGGPFEGKDVTHGVTFLTSGTYTFAFLDRTRNDMMQGWVAVRDEGSDLVTYMQRWLKGVEHMKQQLAYDFEISGEMGAADQRTLDAFQEQLKALDNLSQRLEKAVEAELHSHSRHWRQVRDVFRSAEIRVIPGREEVFRPATKAAFTQLDMQEVRSGHPVSKIILVADYENARWKLERINALYDDLMRCKRVAEQQADWLERRKGLFLLTDHLHDKGEKYVENEMRLQYTLGMIDRFEKRMYDLRERRMALAFISELVAPNRAFSSLDQEEQQCLHELTVLGVELNRLNRLFEETDENSKQRVTIERNRRRVLVTMEKLEGQIGTLNETRETLLAMAKSTNVIHRAGDDRLITATFLAEELPFHVRRAVEQESIMTVRMEATENLFVPHKAALTASWQDGHWWHRKHPGAYAPNGMYIQDPWAPPDDGAKGKRKSKPTRRVNKTDSTSQTESDSCALPFFVQLFVPPCWFADSISDKSQAQKTSQHPTHNKGKMHPPVNQPKKNVRPVRQSYRQDYNR